MPYCIVKMCKNYSSKVRKGHGGVSYFHFPREPVRCARWRIIIAKSRQEEYFDPKESNLVCSQHFSESDIYVTNKGLKRLKKTAVPTLLLSHEISPQNSIDCVTTTDAEIFPDLKQETEKQSTSSHTPPQSPSPSLSIGSILDSARKIKQKKELEKFQANIIMKNRKINNLQKAIKRLKQKNIALKNVLNKFKKRKRAEEYKYPCGCCCKACPSI